MTVYYLMDALGVFAGSVEQGMYAPAPARSVLVAPPETSGAEVAQYVTGGWRILPERPVPPEPQPAPEPVPESVTRAQGKAALIQAGLWAPVVAYVDAIEDAIQQALARVALDDTLEWRRDSPFLNAAAGALGLADGQLDDLFRQAATIQL